MITGTKDNANQNMILVYIIWPLLAVFESIRNYRESWAKNGIWLFVIFFGFTFVPREGNDSWGYVQSLKELHNADMNLSQLFRMLYVEGSRYLDVVQLLITFLVSRFTGDGRILFAVFGALYGFFYSRNLWIIISATEGKLGMVERILLIVIAFVIPIWSLNGVRFWTAAHIFIYGSLQILLYRNMKGFLIAAFSILMHFSFILPLFVLGAYIVAGNRTILYFVFFIVSLVISGIDPLILRTALLQYLPGIFHDRIYSYTNPDFIDDVNYSYATATFYARYYKPVMRIGVSALLILVFLSGKKFWNSVKVKSVYSFSLLFSGIINIISGLGSLGRFERVAQLIGLAGVFLFFYIVPKNHAARRWFYVFLPFLLFFLFTVFRKGLNNTGVYSLISNPVFTPFLPNDMALIDLIK
jgi:hypothetical protein